MRPPGELNLIYLKCAPPAAEAFAPSDGYCPGSKAFLLNFLDRVIKAKVNPVTSFCDPFAGSGAVAVHFAEAGAQVIAGDLRRASYVLNSAFLLANSSNVGRDKLQQMAAYLGALSGRSGPLARRLAPALGAELAGRVQAWRATIAGLAAAGRLTTQEERVLVAAVLQVVGRKLAGRDWGKPGARLALPQLRDFPQTQLVFQRDAGELVREVEAEVLYLDPPLGREESDEGLALLEDVAWGGAGQPGGGRSKTGWSPATQAVWADPARATKTLASLLAGARCRHLFLSYSSEGVIGNRTIWDLLKTRGRPECFEWEHAVVTRNGSGRVTERLFYCALKSECALKPEAD